MYDPRTNLSSQVVPDVRQHRGDTVYDTMIPRNVRVSEAPSYGKPALLYDLKCSGSQAYLKLASEIIQRERRMRAQAARLGRGLAALLGDVAEPVSQPAERPGSGIRRVPIEFIRPNPRNPRKSFDEHDLSDLTQSIREKGIVQPVLVRTSPAGANQFEIIAGERRWRAAQRAGLQDVPVIVQDVTDKEALELAIIENVQRADLNALEEARGYE
eukprot:gene48774-biopygen22315